MDIWPASLALHGIVVLGLSCVAGLLLHRSIRLERTGTEAWHLAHAGGSARGVLLLGVAGSWQWVNLSAQQRGTAAILLLFFVWTSTIAMLLSAASGHRGLTWHGSAADRVVFALYVAGTIAVFPAILLLIVGFARA